MFFVIWFRALALLSFLAGVGLALYSLPREPNALALSEARTECLVRSVPLAAAGLPAPDCTRAGVMTELEKRVARLAAVYFVIAGVVSAVTFGGLGSILFRVIDVQGRLGTIAAPPK